MKKIRRLTLVDGLKINYVTAGRGKPVVMIHGWMGSNEDYPALFPFLSKHFRVIIPDLPGFGESERMKTKSTSENYAKFLLNFLNKLKLKKFYIVGNCSGASIVLDAAAIDGRRFEKMVLFTPFYHKKVWRENVRRIINFVVSPIISNIIRGTARQIIKHDITMNLLLKTYMKHAVGEYGEATKRKKRQANLGVATEFMRDLLNIDLTKKIKGIKIPTLVIHYENDGLANNREVKKIRRFLPNTQFYLAKYRGHFANPDHMVDAYNNILVFLQKPIKSRK